MAVVSVAALLLGDGSCTPAGGATLAVLLSVPSGDVEATVPVRLNVAWPALARSTSALMSPVPLLVVQADPTVAVHVQVTPVSCDGTTSVTVAPLTGLGPPLATTIA
jgi:hypothetical protein